MLVLGGLHINAHSTRVVIFIFKSCTSKVDIDRHKSAFKIVFFLKRWLSHLLLDYSAYMLTG